jgi:acyl-CoA dehydrogenase
MSGLFPDKRWESEDAALFRQTVRRFLAEEAVPHDERWRRQRFVDRAFWEKCGTLGCLCPSISEQYGGGGGTFALEAVLAEELSYATITSFAQSVHGTIVAHYLSAYGDDDQKRRWLPRLCTSEWIGAIGMTEPGAGTDLQALRTTARREGDSYVVNGAKTFITNGLLCDLVILAVKTDALAKAKGITLLVVETADLPGFRRGRNLQKIGMHGSDTAELFFEEMHVPVANVLGREGTGFIQMMTQLPQERLAIAIGAQAMMERAIELTVQYVKSRHAFGKPLLDMQNTRFKLAECLTLARVSRAFVDGCIERHLRGELSASDASMAKYWTTDSQCRVIDECVQLHGGYGYMNEYEIARMYADVRVARIYGGANEIMKELIARSLV